MDARLELGLATLKTKLINTSNEDQVKVLKAYIKRSRSRDKEMNELVQSHDFRSTQTDLTSNQSYRSLH